MIISMRHRLLACVCLTMAFGVGGNAQSPSSSKGTNMTNPARGSFDVKLKPLDAYNRDEGAPVARMSLDKQFHGDLEATSKGEMLSAGTDVRVSGAYVAIERITGTLHGRSGSFTLAHNATMTHGAPYMNIIVVPDSGTDQLKGLSGKMTIIIADGKHSYEFDYAIADAP